MRLNQLTFTVLAVAICQVSALLPRSTLENVFSRQATSCDTACAPFQASVNSCTGKGCLCTSAVASSLQTCVDCAVQADPSAATISAADDLVNTFATTCAGFGLTPVTVPSGDGATGTTAGLPTTQVPPISSTSVDTSAPIPTSLSQIIVRPTPSSTVGGAGTATSPSPSSTASSGGNLPGLNGAASKASGTGVVIIVGALVGMVLAL